MRDGLPGRLGRVGDERHLRERVRDRCERIANATDNTRGRGGHVFLRAYLSEDESGRPSARCHRCENFCRVLFSRAQGRRTRQGVCRSGF